ncbi:MAG TPA: 5'/3'-nucleotidase SurE [Desulfurivibrionaceae bacterium]|nr:5'/3'-nucleotidase SurE [Desulfurivibrionaceae bacterium]
MRQEQPLILVTNDDGIMAPGLMALAEALAGLGRVVVIAPERDNSAASHSLTMRRPLLVREDGPDRFAIDGTPADCVIVGVGKLLKSRPALLVSGINPGPNLGDDISYSGTVSAAIEGTMVGIPALAVSLVLGEGGGGFGPAAAFAARLAAMVLRQGLPPDTLLNVNVPARPASEIRGVRFTRQGRRKYDGAIQETSDPWSRKHYWIGGGTPVLDEGADTDVQAVVAGWVSVTPLHLDRTNYDALAYLAQGWGEGLWDRERGE